MENSVESTELLAFCSFSSSASSLGIRTASHKLGAVGGTPPNPNLVSNSKEEEETPGLLFTTCIHKPCTFHAVADRLPFSSETLLNMIQLTDAVRAQLKMCVLVAWFLKRRKDLQGCTTMFLWSLTVWPPASETAWACGRHPAVPRGCTPGLALPAAPGKGALGPSALTALLPGSSASPAGPLPALSVPHRTVGRRGCGGRVLLISTSYIQITEPHFETKASPALCTLAHRTSGLKYWITTEVMKHLVLQQKSSGENWWKEMIQVVNTLLILCNYFSKPLSGYLSMWLKPQ